MAVQYCPATLICFSSPAFRPSTKRVIWPVKAGFRDLPVGSKPTGYGVLAQY